MREKEHLSLIGVYRDALVLHVIRFASEIRDPTRLNLPDEKISKRELEMAKSLIEQYSEKFEFKNIMMFTMISFERSSSKNQPERSFKRKKWMLLLQQQLI